MLPCRGLAPLFRGLGAGLALSVPTTETVASTYPVSHRTRRSFVRTVRADPVKHDVHADPVQIRERIGNRSGRSLGNMQPDFLHHILGLRDAAGPPGEEPHELRAMTCEHCRQAVRLRDVPVGYGWAPKSGAAADTGSRGPCRQQRIAVTVRNSDRAEDPARAGEHRRLQ